MSGRSPSDASPTAGSGRRSSVDRLVPAVYDELRRVARRQLRRAGGGTLSTDELVHEVYLKLTAAAPLTWADEAHFYGIAARAMRQILVDYARHEQARKRGGGWRRTTLSSGDGAYEVRLDELLALDQALERLTQTDPRLCQIVEYRFFGGMTHDQIAHLLGVSARTVEREWKKAKLFLYRELHPEESPGESET